MEIKEEQQRQWAVLRDLQAHLRGQTGHEEEDVESVDMDLPLRTLEQLDEMERHLEDPGVQKRMVDKPAPSSVKRRFMEEDSFKEVEFCLL